MDKFQGQQNDYILLSLVRTESVGHVRDVRRLVVATSRARLGLYVFCRKHLFENCPDLAPTFSRLLARPSVLQLVSDEPFPSTRLAHEKGDARSIVTVPDVTALGLLVYQMTQQRMRSERAAAEALTADAASNMIVVDEGIGTQVNVDDDGDNAEDEESDHNTNEEDESDSN